MKKRTPKAKTVRYPRMEWRLVTPKGKARLVIGGLTITTTEK